MEVSIAQVSTATDSKPYYARISMTILPNKQPPIKACVTEISIGLIKIEGLLLETGKFAVTVQQSATLFQVRQDNAQREFKALLGKEYRFVKIRVENSRARKAENAILLLDFEVLLAKLDRKGNQFAQNIRDSFVGLSLIQLFSDAFGIKFEGEDRQQYLIHRQTHRENFHPTYTIWLKKDGCVNGYEYAREVNRLKLILNLPLIPIEQYDYAQIAKLNRGEHSYDALRKAGLPHTKALAILSI